MKCNPLGVWCQDRDKENLRLACKSETEISHSNQKSADVCYIHNLAIKFLLNSNGVKDPVERSQKVVDLCFEEIENFETDKNQDGLKEWKNQVNQMYEQVQKD